LKKEEVEEKEKEFNKMRTLETKDNHEQKEIKKTGAICLITSATFFFFWYHSKT